MSRGSTPAILAMIAERSRAKMSCMLALRGARKPVAGRRAAGRAVGVALS